MSIRTFIAVDLDEDIRKAIARACGAIDLGGAKVRWTSPDQLHVTLKFLGDVPDDRVADVCDIVADAAARHDPFHFGVRGLLAIPPAGRKLRMVWAGVTDPTGELAALQEHVETSLLGLGFREETRRFRPHVTAGRFRRVRNVGRVREAVAGLAESDFGVQEVGEAVVYSSLLTPEGAVHQRVAGAPLG